MEKYSLLKKVRAHCAPRTNRVKIRCGSYFLLKGLFEGLDEMNEMKMKILKNVTTFIMKFYSIDHYKSIFIISNPFFRATLYNILILILKRFLTQLNKQTQTHL